MLPNHDKSFRDKRPSVLGTRTQAATETTPLYANLAAKAPPSVLGLLFVGFSLLKFEVYLEGQGT